MRKRFRSFLGETFYFGHLEDACPVLRTFPRLRFAQFNNSFSPSARTFHSISKHIIIKIVFVKRLMPMKGLQTTLNIYYLTVIIQQTQKEEEEEERDNNNNNNNNEMVGGLVAYIYYYGLRCGRCLWRRKGCRH